VTWLSSTCLAALSISRMYTSSYIPRYTRCGWDCGFYRAGLVTKSMHGLLKMAVQRATILEAAVSKEQAACVVGAFFALSMQLWREDTKSRQCLLTAKNNNKTKYCCPDIRCARRSMCSLNVCEQWAPSIVNHTAGGVP
jgi:hypothetical protein